MRLSLAFFLILLAAPSVAAQGVEPPPESYEAVEEFSAVITDIDRAAGTATLLITDPLTDRTVRGDITFDPGADEGAELFVGNRYELAVRRSNRIR